MTPLIFPFPKKKKKKRPPTRYPPRLSSPREGGASLFNLSGTTPCDNFIPDCGGEIRPGFSRCRTSGILFPHVDARNRSRAISTRERPIAPNLLRSPNLTPPYRTCP